MDNSRSPASLMINLESCQQGSGSAIESGFLWPTLQLLVLQQAVDKVDLCFIAHHHLYVLSDMLFISLKDLVCDIVV